MPRSQLVPLSTPRRRGMPGFAALILLGIILVGLLYFLSTQAREVPTRTIEVEVNQAADAQ